MKVTTVFVVLVDEDVVIDVVVVVWGQDAYR